MPAESPIENAPELAAITATEIGRAEAGGNTWAVYRATARPGHNLTVTAQARGFTLTVDEPASFGGANAGPNPEDVVLAGVGACQMITAALYATHPGVPIRGYQVALRGYVHLAGFYGGAGAEQPTGFNRVGCEVTIDSDASPEQLAAFERLVEERCVGHGTLRAPVAIETSWKLAGAATADEWRPDRCGPPC
ncbi:MAG TPA: OsmC family protein [Dehalococcoidia bacterium]|nr:OsmC family protein [Dehalococcoidia bacterium]